MQSKNFRATPRPSAAARVTAPEALAVLLQKIVAERV